MNAEFNDVIVPVDGSESSERAARFAADTVKVTGGQITLVYVFPKAVDNFEFIRIAYAEEGGIERLRQDKSRKVFDKARQAIGDTQQEIREELLAGDPSQEIIRYVKDHPGARIVIGRRGLSSFETLLLGSVSEKVARHATAPVTIVR